MAERYEPALQEAAQISLRPAETRALLLRAEVYRDSGRRNQAIDAFSRAADRDPRNWAIRRDWAVELLAAGRRRQAQRQMNRALALNPRLELPPGFRRSGGGAAR